MESFAPISKPVEKVTAQQLRKCEKEHTGEIPYVETLM